jgi:hypothetical protein
LRGIRSSPERKKGKQWSVQNGFNQAEKRSEEKHQESGGGRKEKTYNRSFAKICAYCAWQASLVCG